MDRLDASKCLHAPRQNSLDVCLCQLSKHPPLFCNCFVVVGGGGLRTLVRWWSNFPPPLPPQQYGRGGAPKYRPFTIALYGYTLYTDKCLRNADDVTSFLKQVLHRWDSMRTRFGCVKRVGCVQRRVPARGWGAQVLGGVSRWAFSWKALCLR